METTEAGTSKMEQRGSEAREGSLQSGIICLACICIAHQVFLCLCLSEGWLVISPTDLCLSAGCLAQAARKLNRHCKGRGGNAVRDCVTQSNKMHKQSKSLSAMPRKIFTVFFSPCIQLRANSLSSGSSVRGSVQQKLLHKVQGTWRRASVGCHVRLGHQNTDLLLILQRNKLSLGA